MRSHAFDFSHDDRVRHTDMDDIVDLGSADRVCMGERRIVDFGADRVDIRVAPDPRERDFHRKICQERRIIAKKVEIPNGCAFFGFLCYTGVSCFFVGSMSMFRTLFLFLILACCCIAPEALAQDAGVFEGSGVSGSDLRAGNITFDDIPNMIRTVTSFVLGLSATIAVFAIIFGAVKLSLGSDAIGGTEGKTDAKNAIIYGIGGFVLAVSSWVIIQFVINNL